MKQYWVRSSDKDWLFVKDQREWAVLLPFCSPHKMRWIQPPKCGIFFFFFWDNGWCVEVSVMTVTIRHKSYQVEQNWMKFSFYLLYVLNIRVNSFVAAVSYDLSSLWYTIQKSLRILMFWHLCSCDFIGPVNCE
jgi:hypothetical protein